MLLRALCGEKNPTTEDTEVHRAETLTLSVLLRALCGAKDITTEDTEERVAETLTLSLHLRAFCGKKQPTTAFTHIVKAPQANASTKALPKSVPAQPQNKN